MKENIQQDGFTFIEILIAMAVLTLGLLSVFLMQIGAVRGNSLAMHLTEVSTRAQDRIEQILSWDADAVTVNLADNNTLYAGAGEDGANITADFRILPGTNRAVDGTVVADNSNPFTIYWNGTAEMDPGNPALQVGYRIEVTVVWNEAGRQRQTIMYVIKPI